MKRLRRLGLVLLLVLTAVLLGACGASTPDDQIAGPAAPSSGAGSVSMEGREIIDIREKMFMTQVNDIYTNANNYAGKGVRFEGVYNEDLYGVGETFHSVTRSTPGCCGDDGARIGFEVVWDQPFPQPGSWAEAAGVLEQYEEDGEMRLRVQLVSLQVLDVRGAELVTQ